MIYPKSFLYADLVIKKHFITVKVKLLKVRYIFPSEFFDESKVQKNSVSLKYKSFEMSLMSLLINWMCCGWKKYWFLLKEKKIPLTWDFWMVVHLITYLTLYIWTMTVMLAFVVITKITQTNIPNLIKS